MVTTGDIGETETRTAGLCWKYDVQVAVAPEPARRRASPTMPSLKSPDLLTSCVKAIYNLTRDDQQSAR